jgi:transcriptional regulator with XRE-family HTH domain
MPKKKPSPRSTNTIDLMIAKRLLARRLERGFSQADLAQALGITFQQVQKYERGKNRVAASRLYAIAGLLDVPLEYFFESATKVGARRRSVG